jgi:squalene synthase HpnC
MTEALGRKTRIGSEPPGEGEVLPLAGGENFPVAMLWLGPRTRAHLMAIYGFARLADQIGDEVEGDRRAQLDLLEQDLEQAFSGEPRHPLLRKLVATIRALGLPREPFLRLIEANRRDQREHGYRTFHDLLSYCELSANPVGELVLYVFGRATPERIRLSDRVCSALQLIEHWQDVAEDYRRGRVYIPAEDLERFGVKPADLGAAHTGEALGKLLAFETERARQLLDEGGSLVGTLRGRARLAVAGYVGGGRAALEAIELAGYDVLAGAPCAAKRRRLAELIRAYGRGC